MLLASGVNWMVSFLLGLLKLQGWRRAGVCVVFPLMFGWSKVGNIFCCKNNFIKSCIKTKTELPSFRPVSLQIQKSHILSRESTDLLKVKNKYHFLMELGFYPKLTSRLIANEYFIF